MLRISLLFTKTDELNDFENIMTIFINTVSLILFWCNIMAIRIAFESELTEHYWRSMFVKENFTISSIYSVNMQGSFSYITIKRLRFWYFSLNFKKLSNYKLNEWIELFIVLYAWNYGGTELDGWKSVGNVRPIHTTNQ